MRSESTCNALRQLWVIHNYSLVSYLIFAPPHWGEEDGAALQLLKDIHRDQQQLADRIGKMVLEYGGKVAVGNYPLRFTAMHDLSSKFLWAELLGYQQRTIDANDRLIAQLPVGTIAQALAQECLGAAKAHLDSLNEYSDNQVRIAI